MKTVDDRLGRHTNGGNEELGSTLDDDGDQVIEFTLSVIVACGGLMSALGLGIRRADLDLGCAYLVFLALPPT